MATDFTYRIEGLAASQHPRGYSFRIELDLDFARKVRAVFVNWEEFMQADFHLKETGWIKH